MSKPKVRKAVIAAAGFGTRFLPFTKAMPKEMLPLVDKPIIQYIVEELVDAGIEDVVIVTGYHKRAIEDHFDHTSMELRSNLKQGGKEEIFEKIREISTLANFAYVRQKGPYGSASPLVDVEHLIGNEPFIYTFADDFVRAKPSRFKQLLAARDERGGSVLTCIRRSGEEDYSRYGYVGGKQVGDRLYQVDTIIEKPGSAAKAPSDLATVSGYVLEPAIFPYLHEELAALKEGEFMIQPAMQKMIQDGHDIYGCEIQDGVYHDTGNKMEYLKTVFDFALERDDIGHELCDYLREKLQG
ncbi:MAG TPA: UTP--glucose-1-phosphate uridylyltransferase [Candidatus Saccharimonadales bacterium]|nr:UTP--glucose-1-phosphate uridylyltransferase [Candidatus Saccharimonadales bacterium]